MHNFVVDSLYMCIDRSKAHVHHLQKDGESWGWGEGGLVANNNDSPSFLFLFDGSLIYIYKL